MGKLDAMRGKISKLKRVVRFKKKHCINVKPLKTIQRLDDETVEAALAKAGYHVISIIDGGTNAAVYKCSKQTGGGDDGIFAVRVPHDKTGDDDLYFLRKFSNLDGIVELITTVYIEGCLCSVMPFYNTDLFNYIVAAYSSNKDGLSNDYVVNFVKQLLDAMGKMHGLDYAHGDFKPENVMIDNRNVGYPILRIGDLEYVTNCSARAFINRGTHAFASPQIQAGEETTGGGADAWALGVCIFIMCTGRYPWMKASMKDSQYRLYAKTGKFFLHSNRTLVEVENEVLFANHSNMLPELLGYLTIEDEKRMKIPKISLHKEE